MKNICFTSQKMISKSYPMLGMGATRLSVWHRITMASRGLEGMDRLQ